MSIWGNVILPQKVGFVFGDNRPNVPCLWFNTGGSDTPEDPDVTHGMLLHIDEDGNRIPLYPMTTIAAIYGLEDALISFNSEIEAVINSLKGTILSSTISIKASEWTGDSAPFTQKIQFEGILETDNPHYGIVFSGTNEQKMEQKESFGFIDELKTENGFVTFTCLEYKPEVDLTVQIEVNRVAAIESDISGFAVLRLKPDESGFETVASIDGDDYGVENATVNQEATSGSYDFTVL